MIRERSKSLELEFPPSYSYSSTISCCSVGSQPPRTTEMSVVILSIGPTTHFYLTLRKGAPETETIERWAKTAKNILLWINVHRIPRTRFSTFFFFFQLWRAGLLFLKILYRSTYYFSYFPLYTHYYFIMFTRVTRYSNCTDYIYSTCPPPFSLINKLLFLKL